MVRATNRTYSDERNRLSELGNRRSAAGRDISPLPENENPERRSICGESLQSFCEIYHAQTFTLGWSPDHLQVISKLETTIRFGGLFGLGMPRGSGKTSLLLAALEWGVLYGYRKFLVLVAGEEGLASSLLQSIRIDLESNQLLLADFPETCYPIHRLERINHRTRGQTLNGSPTSIEASKRRLVLPTVPGSVASGSVIHCVGITGSIRGLQHKTQSGEVLRPDCCLIDDPKTTSPLKVQLRLQPANRSYVQRS